MQRGQVKVPGQGGLDSALRRLAIPDLADEHNVGVLTQDAPQAVGERHVRLDVDLHLVDSVQVGPEMTIMPYGWLMTLLKRFNVSLRNPRFSRGTMALLLSRIRITIFSP